jgi:hypothetical protein
MGIDVDLQKPDSLDDAMSLARAFERCLQLSEDTQRLLGRGSRAPPRAAASLSGTPKSPATPAPSGSSSTTPGTPVKPAAPGAPVKPAAPGARFTRLSPEEMAQRRMDGLCFNCPEKFSREHARQCSMKGIFWMELDTDDNDAEHSDASAADPEISTNAITGIQTSSMLQLATVVHVVGLHWWTRAPPIRSSTAAVAARVGLVPEPCAGLSVGVPNGDRVPCAGICRNVAIFIGHEEFAVDLFVIQLGGFDIVLGCEWLRTLGPILWDLNVLSMAFWRHDHRVQWFGVNARPSPGLSALATDALLSLLLEEFQDLFSTPLGLPPPRAFDHRIHLLPGSLPVAVRPYRYPQLLKDEIEA